MEVFCMATTNLNIHTDMAIKNQTKEILSELGLNMPTDTTTAAIEEGRKIMNDPSAPRYSNMNALKAALDL